MISQKIYWEELDSERGETVMMEIENMKALTLLLMTNDKGW